MAPRRKVGLTRMDAALDFFSQLGYSRTLVRKTVNRLLKVYGGDEGWVFLEEAQYSVVLDTILEDQEKENAVALKDDSSKDIHQTCTADVNEDPGAGPSCIDHGNLSHLLHCVQKDDSSKDIHQMCAADVNEDPGATPSCINYDKLSQTSVAEEFVGWRDICISNSEEVDNGAYLERKNPETDPIHLTETSTDLPSIREPTSPSPFPRRKPCYGWISDDEDEATDMQPPRKYKSRWDVGPATL